MKTDKILNFSAKSVFKLDPTAERYRVCPECEKPFMTPHLGRDYCSKKCANDHNNRNKRHDKHAADVIASPTMPETRESKLEPTPLIKQEVRPHLVSPVVVPVTTKEAVIATIDDSKQATNAKQFDSPAKKKNDSIFSAVLGDKKEINVPWIELVQQGLDLTAYDSIEKLPHYNVNKANYGNYSIVWVSPDLILITTQKQLLWTSTSIQ